MTSQEQHVELPTEALRERRASVRDRLDEVEALAGSLPGSEPEVARARMTRIVSVLEEELLPYMEFEGRILHPIIDKFACEGPMAFSASVQYEHRVIDRWIGDLAASARDTSVDARAFARRVDRLLGLLAGHFEVEDRVFLPVLDRALPVRW